MGNEVHAPGSIRFGAFEVDLRSRELRRNGVRLRLPDQSFQVLAMLLERPGEMVTREEIRKRLWPSDTFVDFDHGVNSAVNRLREALGDSAENPRFIQTLPRRGYRFITTLSGYSESSQSTQSILGVVPSVVVRTTRRTLSRSVVFLLLAISASIVAIWLIRSLSTERIPRITGSKRLTFTGQVLGPRYPFGWVDTFPSLATDGKRVYYSSLQQFRNRLAYVSVVGGDQVLLSVPLFADLRHISPDGSTLLASGTLEAETEDHLWFIPSAGGEAQQIVNIDGHDGAWSPDGRRIAFAYKLELFVADNDGRNSHRIATTPGQAFWLRWSPDSTRVRFTVVDQNGGKSTLWECRSDGSNLHRLSLSHDYDADECCGEWTKDGRYFLYRVFQKSHADIWAVRETGFRLFGDKPVRLTTGPLDSMDAVLSYDGRQLLTLEVQERSELHRLDLRSHQLTPYLTGSSATDSRRLPGIDQIVYIESRGKETKVWRSRPDGSMRLQLTGPPLLVFRISPAPDGKQIALMGKMPNERWRIYLVPSGGGPRRAVTSNEQDVADPTWSPDSTSIMFGGVPNWWPGGSKRTSISIINLASGKITIVPGSDGLFSPRWSPDGRYIVAMSDDFERLMLYDFANERWRELARGAFDFPEWYPNSKYVYVTERRGYTKLMRLTREDGKRDEVLNLESVNPKAQMCWMITPPEEHSLLVSCTIPAGDIYALDLDLP